MARGAVMDEREWYEMVARHNREYARAFDYIRAVLNGTPWEYVEPRLRAFIEDVETAQRAESADNYDVLECRIVESPFGQALLVRVHRNDMQPMGYSELYDVLQEHYPARWWLQSGPWPERLLDQANKYHVWLLQEGVRPACFDLFEEQ